MKYLLIILLLSSCYTARVAKKDFGKAVSSYPALGADYCAITYPVKEKVIQGKDSVRIDTLWGAGEIHFDTVYSRARDTIRITQFVKGNTIRETYYRVDTVYQENMAAIKALQLQLADALTLSVDNAKAANKWEAIAKKRFWIIVGLGVLIALYLGFKIYRATRKLPK